MIPTAGQQPSNSRTRERAVSPALGFAIALIVTVVLAVAVGVLVGTIAEDPEPDADFEWDQTGEGETLQITLEHAGGDEIDGSDLTLEASGVRGIDGNTTLGDWGTVGNGSTLTVGFVADARIERRNRYFADGDLSGQRINGTDAEDGIDVIAVAVEGGDLTKGRVLVSDLDNGDAVDVSMTDLQRLRVTWQGRWGTTELAEHAVEP